MKKTSSSPKNTTGKSNAKRKKEAIDFLKNSSTTSPIKFDETDPVIASISITQGADPNGRFKYHLSVEMKQLLPNPENLRGFELGASIIFNMEEELGRGYESDTSNEPGTPLPKSYLLKGIRTTIINTHKVVLSGEVWPFYAAFSAKPPFSVDVQILKNGLEYGEPRTFEKVYLTQDLQVPF